MPVASIIMPCYNHARFLGEAVRSILDQTEIDLELIIVDDCSRDSSWNIIQGFRSTDWRVTAIRHSQNLGASRSRNDGLKLARGNFIGFCDADDMWEEEKLRRQIDLLSNFPKADLTYCDSLIIDENSRPTGKKFSDLYPPPRTHSGQIFHQLIDRNFINMQTVLIRNASASPLLRFDESIKWVEDWWCWIQFSRAHQMLYSPECLARYRIHSGNSNQMQKRSCGFNRFKVLKHVLKSYPTLPVPDKATVLHNMGGELCDIGLKRHGTKLLWQAAALSASDPRSLRRAFRALGRIARNSVKDTTSNLHA